MIKQRDLLWGVLILAAAAGGSRLLLHQAAPPSVSVVQSQATVPVIPGASATPWTDWAQVAPALDLKRYREELTLERSFNVDGVSLGMTKDEVVASLGPAEHEENMLVVDILQYHGNPMIILKSHRVDSVTGHRLFRNGQLLCEADRPIGKALDALGSHADVKKGIMLRREWRSGPVEVNVDLYCAKDKPPTVLMVTLSPTSGL